MSQLVVVVMINMERNWGALHLSVKYRPFLQSSLLIEPVLLNVTDHWWCSWKNFFEPCPECLLQLGRSGSANLVQKGSHLLLSFILCEWKQHGYYVRSPKILYCPSMPHGIRPKEWKRHLPRTWPAVSPRADQHENRSSGSLPLEKRSRWHRTQLQHSPPWMHPFSGHICSSTSLSTKW